MPSELCIRRAHVLVSGDVQGVGYRAFAWNAASGRELFGGVRNLSDGRVEVEVEGDQRKVEAFIEVLKAGPPMARVKDVQVTWESPTGREVDFQVWY